MTERLRGGQKPGERAAQGTPAEQQCGETGPPETPSPSIRNAALEAAARLAEEWPPRRWMTTKQLAAAIRALKEEPTIVMKHTGINA